MTDDLSKLKKYGIHHIFLLLKQEHNLQNDGNLRDQLESSGSTYPNSRLAREMAATRYLDRNLDTIQGEIVETVDPCDTISLAASLQKYDFWACC